MMISSTTTKYRSKKSEYNGIKFDSKLELNIYKEILNLQKQYNFEVSLQVPFELVPKFRLNNNAIRNMVYKADFVIKYNNKTYVIDAKGLPTEAYKVKKKIFMYLYKMDIIELKSVKAFKEWFSKEVQNNG